MGLWTWDKKFKLKCKLWDEKLDAWIQVLSAFSSAKDLELALKSKPGVFKMTTF